jgi:hypothetical protein
MSCCVFLGCFVHPRAVFRISENKVLRCNESSTLHNGPISEQQQWSNPLAPECHARAMPDAGRWQCIDFHLCSFCSCVTSIERSACGPTKRNLESERLVATPVAAGAAADAPLHDCGRLRGFCGCRSRRLPIDRRLISALAPREEEG